MFQIKDLKELFNVSEFFIVKKNHLFDFSKIGIREKMYISDTLTEVFEKNYYLVLNDKSVIKVPSMILVADCIEGTNFIKEESDIESFIEYNKISRDDIKAIVVNQLKKQNEEMLYNRYSVYWLN